MECSVIYCSVFENICGFMTSENTMKADVSICDDQAEYYLEEGCFINELSNSENDAEVSIARARVACGGQTRWHHKY